MRAPQDEGGPRGDPFQKGSNLEMPFSSQNLVSSPPFTGGREKQLLSTNSPSRGSGGVPVCLKGGILPLTPSLNLETSKGPGNGAD